ncbi:hypothetical protein V2J09_018289 [Rumex salicifolius]
MASLCTFSHPISTSTTTHIRCKSLKASRYANLRLTLQLPKIQLRHLHMHCTKMTPWEPSPVTYAPVDEIDDDDAMEANPPNIFSARESEELETALISSTDKPKETSNKPQSSASSLLKWPLWLLGPSLLLATGMVPTLWLPLSSIFLGPNIASLLSLIGLDCIFNLGSTLFLLMAHTCARPKDLSLPYKSKPPKSYQFWNMVASIAGFLIPLALLFGSDKGYLLPQLTYISFAVLLGPYLLLLSVQMLTEALTWHWRSPVWLVTPVVYEAYRVLQLMRSLKLSAELAVPVWMLHSLRCLVCWWVLILGVQLMRVAWFAGFSAKTRHEKGTPDKAIPTMATGELLSVESLELQFPFELNKQISCTIHLTNKTDQHVAFKVKTTNPKKYCVRPNTGIVLPHSNCGVLVTMQAQKEAPPDMQSKDKFLLQSAIASSGSDPKDITPEMFNKDSGNLVEECKLRVLYVPPQQSASPPHRGLEEDTSPGASVLNDGSLDTSEFAIASKTDVDNQDNFDKEKALVDRLRHEIDSVNQQNKKLHQELELLGREAKRSHGSGIPFMYVVIIGLVSILLGYFIKKV